MAILVAMGCAGDDEHAPFFSRTEDAATPSEIEPTQDGGTDDAGDAAGLDAATLPSQIRALGALEYTSVYMAGKIYGAGPQDPSGIDLVLGVQNRSHSAGVYGAILEDGSEPHYTNDSLVPDIAVSPYGMLVYLQYTYDDLGVPDRHIALSANDLVPKAAPMDPTQLLMVSKNPYANDTVLKTLCSPRRFFVSPDVADIVYLCEPSDEGYRHISGKPYIVPSGFDVVHLGFAKHALVYGALAESEDDAGEPSASAYAVLDAKGALHAVTNQALPDPLKERPISRSGVVRLSEFIAGVRATKNGFFIAAANELFEIAFDGSVKSKGKYPGAVVDDKTTVELASGDSRDCDACTYHVSINYTGCAMEGSGNLICIGQWRRSDEQTMALTIRLLAGSGKYEILGPVGFGPATVATTSRPAAAVRVQEIEPFSTLITNSSWVVGP